MFYERIGSQVVSVLPPWLLLSSLGVVTRELASRQVQEGIVPALVSDSEAQPKADFLAKKLRRNFDDRIQRMLAPGGYGSAEKLVGRFVDAELRELETTIRGIDDIVSNEITQAIMEVVEVETVGRIQSLVSDAVQLNQSSAQLDLVDIMKRADADGNEIITFDELYELISGAPIDPLLAPLAKEWPVLKSESAATSRWDVWGSLLIAPQVKSLARVTALARRLYDRGEKQSTLMLDEMAKQATHMEWRMRDLMRGTRDAMSSSLGVEPIAPTITSSRDTKLALEAMLDGERVSTAASGPKRPRRRILRPWTWLRRRAENRGEPR